MNVLLVPDGHYYETSNGDIYVDSVYTYEFYKRYLQSYEKVYAIVRIEKVEELPYDNMKIASGDNVIFLQIPNFTGPVGYLKNFLNLRSLLREYIKYSNVAILRVPSATANICYWIFKQAGITCALEVVVDPWQYFAQKTVKSFFRPIIRIIWTLELKKMCSSAQGVSYVTEHYLQERYPCKALLDNKSKNYFTASYSSVELPDATFGSPKEYDRITCLRIVHVANAFTGYGKGHIELINIVKLMQDKGFPATVDFIGDGPLKEEFLSYANNIGVIKNVNFLGKLPDSAEVRKKMSEYDIFVFPTKAEGLPRVLLEAMSIGLPCVSSPVCGIPEVLSKEYLVDYKDINKYSQLLIDLMLDSNLLEKMSKENIITAMQYSSSILNKKRKNFYDKLRFCVKKEN